MNSYFVYRSYAGDWSVSRRIDGDNWEHVAYFTDWQTAFDRAFRLARQDRNRYRPWWPSRPEPTR